MVNNKKKAELSAGYDVVIKSGKLDYEAALAEICIG